MDCEYAALGTSAVPFASTARASLTTTVDPFLSLSTPSVPPRFLAPSLPTPSSTRVIAFAAPRKTSAKPKGRPVSMVVSPPSSPANTLRYSPSKRASSTRPPSPAPFVGSSASGDWAANFVPPSPLALGAAAADIFTSPTLASAALPTDVEMASAYATPPTAMRILPSMTHLTLTPPDSTPRSLTERSLPHQLRPIVTATSQPLTPCSSTSSNVSNSSSKSLQTLHLQSAPLTPPLTPPCFSTQQFTPVIPSIQLVPSPTTFPTISARLLSRHVLHPLFAEQYSILEELGSGGFGFVVSARRLLDGKVVAVKFIFRNKVPNHGWVNSRHWGAAPGLIQREDGVRIVPMEAYVLRNVRHDGVVAFVDLFEDESYFYLVMEHHGSPWQQPDKNPTPGASTSPADLPALAASVAAQQQGSATSYMVPATEFVSSPVSSPTCFSPMVLSPPRPTPMARRSSCDLFECIEQHSRFSEDVARYVWAQIVEVVWALGKIGICHRDIKDENIVIDHAYKVKLIDFGSAVIFDPRRPPPLYNRFHGTTSFASAEILRGEPYQAPTSEVWSLGILLSILITGECPFVDASAAAAGRLTTPKVRIERDIADLMLRCLDLDVDRRITIDEIREHPWVKGALLARA